MSLVLFVGVLAFGLYMMFPVLRNVSRIFYGDHALIKSYAGTPVPRNAEFNPGGIVGGVKDVPTKTSTDSDNKSVYNTLTVGDSNRTNTSVAGAATATIQHTSSATPTMKVIITSSPVATRVVKTPVATGHSVPVVVSTPIPTKQMLRLKKTETEIARATKEALCNWDSGYECRMYDNGSLEIVRVTLQADFRKVRLWLPYLEYNPIVAVPYP